VDPNTLKYFAAIFLIFENDEGCSMKKSKCDAMNEFFRISCDCKSIIYT